MPRGMAAGILKANGRDVGTNLIGENLAVLPDKQIARLLLSPGAKGKKKPVRRQNCTVPQTPTQPISTR